MLNMRKVQCNEKRCVLSLDLKFDKGFDPLISIGREFHT